MASPEAPAYSSRRVPARASGTARDQIGLAPDGLAEARLALGPLPLLDQERAQRRVPRRVVGQILHRAAERGQRLGPAAELLVHLAEPRARLCIFGTQRQRVREDAEHPLQVLLGHGLVAGTRAYRDDLAVVTGLRRRPVRTS